LPSAFTASDSESFVHLFKGGRRRQKMTSWEKPCPLPRIRGKKLMA